MLLHEFEGGEKLRPRFLVELPHGVFEIVNRLLQVVALGGELLEPLAFGFVVLERGHIDLARPAASARAAFRSAAGPRLLPRLMPASRFGRRRQVDLVRLPDAFADTALLLFVAGLLDLGGMNPVGDLFEVRPVRSLRISAVSSISMSRPLYSSRMPSRTASTSVRCPTSAACSRRHYPPYRQARRFPPRPSASLRASAASGQSPGYSL